MDATIPRSSVHSFLRSLNGLFFTVEFIKRSDGTRRVMRATTNYTSKTVGGSLPYDPNAKHLIPVWDLDKHGFRSIPTDAVLVIRAKGSVLTVVD